METGVDDQASGDDPVSEDIINSAEYITSAEDMLFEACRYIESHSPQTSNISTTVASNVSEPRGQKVSLVVYRQA